MTSTTRPQPIMRWRLRQTFDVPGQPVGKGRPRFARVGNGVRTYTPKTTLDYEARVAWRCANRLTKAPVRVVIHAVFKRPKRLQRRADPDGLIWHAAKPELDKVIKAVLDGCQGRAYADDRQVVLIEAQAHYAEKTGSPRTEIEIYDLQPTNQLKQDHDDDPADLASSTPRPGECRSHRTLDPTTPRT